MDGLMTYLSLEGVTLLFSIAGVVLALVKIWQKWSIKMAEHKEFVITELAVGRQRSLDNEKLIREHKDNTDLEISKLKKLHEDDVRDIHSSIEKSFLRLHVENREDHNKLFDRIGNISNQLTEVCATFKDHKETHEKPINGRTKKRI